MFYWINGVAKMTVGGIFIGSFPIPTTLGGVGAITDGPDGNLWFAEGGGNKIGIVTTGGTITEFPIPTAASGAYAISNGPTATYGPLKNSGSGIGKFAFRAAK